MPLKITLRPKERIIIGGTVVKNGDTKCVLMIENKVPVLRQRDIMSEEAADSPCRRIYLVIQLMYIDRDNLKTYHHKYWQLVRDVLDAAPSTLNLIDQISENILVDQYYRALKLAGKLITYEQEMLKHV